jgi:hypothetical protein
MTEQSPSEQLAYKDAQVERLRVRLTKMTYVCDMQAQALHKQEIHIAKLEKALDEYHNKRPKSKTG